MHPICTNLHVLTLVIPWERRCVATQSAAQFQGYTTITKMSQIFTVQRLLILFAIHLHDCIFPKVMSNNYLIDKDSATMKS